MIEIIVGIIIDQVIGRVLDKLWEGAAVVMEFEEDLQWLRNELKCPTILPKDAKKKMRKLHSVANWVKKVEDVITCAENIVKECKGQTSGNIFFRYRMGRKIKQVKERMNKIHEDPTIYLILPALLSVHTKL
eukprot:Gb_14234 [translate_table: standard]